ncbi:MAG: hypothetical protein M0T72_10870 [Candidatus Dormibacteraeota bacterium]|nr:hypothetical protein [Candidatus Dormibacteraeota bacterium]
MAGVGGPDPTRTQIATTFATLAQGGQVPDELAREPQEHGRRVTAPYRYPRVIRCASELPETVSRKIRRAELRERLGAAGGG